MLEKKSDKFDNLAKKCKICVTIPFYICIWESVADKERLLTHFNNKLQ